MAIVSMSAPSVPNADFYITSNLSRAPVWYGDLVVAQPGTMGLIGSNGYGASYNGEFTYSSSGKGSGQVFSARFVVDATQTTAGAFSGASVYQISELNGTDGLSAERLYRFAVNGKSTEALKYLLSRGDTIYGTGYDTYSVDEILYGWGGKDRIFGIDGNDVIGGGAGRDTLTGGNGQDYFFLDSTKAKDMDTITDFGFGEVRDTIVLLKSAFGDLALGELSADQFVVGTAALDLDDRIILNGNKLLYDADGSGIGSAVTIARVNYAEILPTGVLALSASDLLIVDSIETIVPLV